ncbi:MAG: ATP-binding protein [Deltaproteobacteria bacterium]|nr:ATP-binding protein [Deltaproteobacteria bacterium]
MPEQQKPRSKSGKPQALGELDHRIIATVREPLIVLDGGLRVISANDSFYRTFKVIPQETEGRLIFEIGNRQWDIPRLRILLENILLTDQQFQDFEVDQDFPEIGRRTMLLNARRLTPGKGAKDLILLAIEDITGRKRLEAERQMLLEKQQVLAEELAVANEELQVQAEELLVQQEELLVRQEELESQASELKASNQELESFSYSVAHDLKTPVRAIEGFSRMLMGEHAAQLDAEALRLLQVICTNTRIMRQLVDGLLGLSRLARQPMRKSDVSLGDIARQAFERLKSEEPDRNLQLTIHDLPSAYADHSLLRQVMMSILGNAIKYTRDRETAVIEVGGRIEGNENIYYVKDNGIGFDQRYTDKLFSPFQRLHGLEEYEGTGIGLAIVQRIIQKHGGLVWAEGKVNEGATFYFALPKNAGGGGRRIG